MRRLRNLAIRKTDGRKKKNLEKKRKRENQSNREKEKRMDSRASVERTAVSSSSATGCMQTYTFLDMQKRTEKEIGKRQERKRVRTKETDMQ